MGIDGKTGGEDGDGWRSVKELAGSDSPASVGVNVEPGIGEGGVEIRKSVTVSGGSLTTLEGSRAGESELMPGDWEGLMVNGSGVGEDTKLGERGRDEGGMSVGGMDEGGMDEGGMSVGGKDEGGMSVGGKDEGGISVGGKDEGGMSVGGMEEGGMSVGGMEEGGMSVGGMEEGGTDEGGKENGGMDEGGKENGGMDEGGKDEGSMVDGSGVGEDTKLGERSRDVIGVREEMEMVVSVGVDVGKTVSIVEDGGREEGGIELEVEVEDDGPSTGGEILGEIEDSELELDTDEGRVTEGDLKGGISKLELDDETKELESAG